MIILLLLHRRGLLATVATALLGLEGSLLVKQGRSERHGKFLNFALEKRNDVMGKTSSRGSCRSPFFRPLDQKLWHVQRQQMGSS
jgi:hypothetical protein